MASETTAVPDWVLAPATVLREWMRVNGLRPAVLAAACAGRDAQAGALALIEDVLARRELTAGHAACLAAGTFVPVEFWLSFEHNYRAGLALGLADVTA